jgi:hypothetical protein
MRTPLFVAMIALALPGCMDGITDLGGGVDVGDDDVGGGGGGGGGSGSSTPTPRLDATVDKTSVMSELGKTESLTITIHSMDGFSGSVPVSATVMDAGSAVTGWMVTPTPASVDIAAGGTATVSLSVKIPTDSAALQPQIRVDLGGGSPMTVTSAFNVTKKVTINIPPGTGTGAPHTGMPLNQPLRILAGTQVVYTNNDTIQHVIHASGGIAHENTSLGMPGTSYMVTVNADATWYCHNHEGTGQARIVNIP